MLRSRPYISCSAVAILLCAGCGNPTTSSHAAEESTTVAATPTPTDTTSGTGATGSAGTTGSTSTDANTTGSDTNTTTTPTADVGDLILRGSGFIPHIGQDLSAIILDANTKQAVGGPAVVTKIDTTGAFTLTWKGALEAGKQYDVYYFADLNKNGFCNAPPTDHSWAVSFAALAGRSVVSVTHNDTFVPVCEHFGTFNLIFDSNNGLIAHGHPNHNAYGVVVDAADKSLVGEIKSGVISATGEVKFAWPTVLLPKHNYVFALCLDDAGNGTCDPDHAFVYDANAVTANVAEGFVVHVTQQTTFSTFNMYWPANAKLPPTAANAPSAAVATP